MGALKYGTCATESVPGSATCGKQAATHDEKFYLGRHGRRAEQLSLNGVHDGADLWKGEIWSEPNAKAIQEAGRYQAVRTNNLIRGPIIESAETASCSAAASTRSAEASSSACGESNRGIKCVSAMRLDTSSDRCKRARPCTEW